MANSNPAVNKAIIELSKHFFVSYAQETEFKAHIIVMSPWRSITVSEVQNLLHGKKVKVEIWNKGAFSHDTVSVSIDNMIVGRR